MRPSRLFFPITWLVSVLGFGIARLAEGQQEDVSNAFIPANKFSILRPINREPQADNRNTFGRIIAIAPPQKNVDGSVKASPAGIRKLPSFHEAMNKQSQPEFSEDFAARDGQDSLLPWPSETLRIFPLPKLDLPEPPSLIPQIGRASCRERVSPYV